jgi:hypothetical protein
VPPAQVFTGLEPDVAGAWKVLLHRRPEVAEAAAGIEHTPDPEAEVIHVGAGEPSELQRVRARGDAGARIHVIAAIEARVE